MDLGQAEGLQVGLDGLGPRKGECSVDCVRGPSRLTHEAYVDVVPCSYHSGERRDLVLHRAREFRGVGVKGVHSAKPHLMRRVHGACCPLRVQSERTVQRVGGTSETDQATSARLAEPALKDVSRVTGGRGQGHA